MSSTPQQSIGGGSKPTGPLQQGRQLSARLQVVARPLTSSLFSSAQCRACVSIAEHSHLALGIGKAHPGRIDRIVDGDAQIAMNLLRIGVLRPDA